MYRRILVPVDGSATATLGLRHAVGLAKPLGAEIRLLTVIDELLVPSIDAYAPVDLANRRRGLTRLLLGSDAERVLRHADVPVLLVRSEAPK